MASRVILGLAAVVALGAASNVCVTQPCAPNNIVADFVFMIDSSNAYEPEEFEQVRNFLSTFTSGLTLDSQKGSQVALYSYGAKTVSAGKLSDLNTSDKVSAAIAALKWQDATEKDLGSALAAEQAEVTEANGLRADSEKILVVLARDAWSGSDIFTSQIDALRAKFDAILVVGMGVQAADNAFQEIRKLAGEDRDVFFVFDLQQLPYAGLWIYKNACPGQHVVPTTVAPTTLPTVAPSTGCDVTALNQDIYLIVDTSASMPAADFADMKKAVYDFVAVFPLGRGHTQLGLIATYADSQLFNTGINSNYTDRANILHTIETLQQEIADGQTLKLSLQAVEGAYLKSSTATNKIVVYITGNTNFDSDPTSYISTLSSTYGMRTLAVRWTDKATITTLASLAGGLRCVIDGSHPETRTTIPTLIHQSICLENYCR